MNKEETPVPSDDEPQITSGAEILLENEKTEDEIFKNFVSRYGILIVFVMAVVIGFVALSKKKEEKTYTANEAATTIMLEGLPKLKDKDYEGFRKECQAILDHPDGKNSPLAYYAEFLIVRSHVIEAQAKLAKDGTLPEDALKKVDDFINKHKSGKNSAQIENLNFAKLAKGCLLEDMGRSEEAQKTYKEIDINSAAYHMANSFANETSLNDRKKKWNLRLEDLKKP